MSTSAMAEPILEPQDDEAEQSVLGAILLAGTTGTSARTIAGIRETGLEPHDFYKARHALVYRAALALVDKNEPTDPLCVIGELRKREQLDLVDGEVAVRELAALASTTANAPHWTRRVLDASHRRRQFSAGQALVRASLNGGLECAPELRATLERVLEEHMPSGSSGDGFLSLDDFLAQTEDLAPALLGTDAESYLARGGLLIEAGEGGGSKTTLMLDAVAHMASGTDWLGIPVARPVRFAVIENEGARAKFRQKFAEKAEAWPGERFEQNVFVYQAPWGSFSFAEPSQRAELRRFCAAEAIDVVVGDPLDSLGVTGVGSPEDTRNFIAWLKECGLGTEVAFWLLHHFSKAQQTSVVQQLQGAWGGHPDTIMGVKLDGTQRTKIEWSKLRSATPTGTPTLLEWIIEERGFRAIELKPGVSDEDLLERMREHLARVAEGVSTRSVQKQVKGDNKRIAQLLNQSDEFANQGSEARPKWVLAGENAVSGLFTDSDAVEQPAPHSTAEMEWR